MKRLASLTAAVALLAALAPANAADLLSGGLKDGNSTAFAPFQGFYGEIALGYGFSQNQIGFVNGGGDLAATGTMFNLRAGYDKLISHHFGAGLYAQGSNVFDVNGSLNGAKFGEHWSYGVGGKAFYDYGTGQAYVLTGWEGTDIGAGDLSRHLDGVLWGVGTTVKITPNAYVKLEFDQIYFGKLTGGTGADAWSLETVDNRIMFGVGFVVN